MTGTRSARVAALAKINLGLKVLHRHPDGFHELRTVFQTISLADEIGIEFTPGRGTAVSVESDVDIPGENLIERAARLVMAESGARGEAQFRLKKNIPLGAGLGGGSSDAAAVLLALPVLAGKRIAIERLLELAGELGSDVPFFLLGGTAVGLGRGGELYPIEPPAARRAVLVAPGIHVSTAEAYRALGRGLTSNSTERSISSFQSLVWMLSSEATEGPAEAQNDFETVVFRAHPELARIRREIARLGANPARMSGSGSAVFGLFATRTQAERARRSLDGRVFAVRLVSGPRYRAIWRRRLDRHITGTTWPPQSRYA